MKFYFIKKVLIALILTVALTLSIPFSFAFAQEKLDENSVRFYDVFTIDASEKLTLCAPNYVYEVDFSLDGESVKTHEIKNAKKAYSSLNSLVYLIDEILYLDGSEIATNVTDFYAEGGVIIYCNGDGIFKREQQNGQSTLLDNTPNAFAVTAHSDAVYFANKTNGYCNVFKISNDETVLLHSKKRTFDKLVFDDALYGIGQNTIYDFSTISPVDLESESFTIKNGTTYYIKSNNIYTDEGFKLGSGNEIFFPTSVDSSLGQLVVTDYNGVHVYNIENSAHDISQTFKDDEINEYTCSAICPHCSAIYFASKNVLYKWLDGQITKSEYEHTINSVAIDVKGNVFVCTNSIYKNDEILYENLSGEIEINKANNSLLCYDGSVFYLNGAPTFEKTDVISFDVDDNGNLFTLSTNAKVEKLDEIGNVIASYQFACEQAVSISILRSQQNAGKLAIVDYFAHNVIFSDDKLATVFESVNPSLESYDESLVRKTTANTVVYSDLLQTTALASLNENSTVFCLIYDIETNPNFSLVAIKGENGVLTLGYVFKDSLSSVIDGELPLYDTATTFYDDVHILALPFNLEQAPNAKLLTIENKDDTVELISKINVFGHDWYKVRYNQVVGFVSAPSLQLGQYVPTIRPNVNATVLTTVVTYEKDDGNYVETNVFIGEGYRVEIVGVFDSNVEFTLVKYYDENAGGTRTCYVKTSALEYDHTTPEQQIALIVIVVLSITTLIAIIIGIGVHKSKQH